MTKVEYFIVGAPKCGTSSIHTWLNNRLDISTTKEKETHFFSYDDVKSHYYHTKSVKYLNEYEAQFGNSTGKKIDICPSYMCSKKAVEAIFEYNENAKIIFLIRNPIERAVSHLKMDINLGYKSLKEAEKLKFTPDNKFQYIENSKFSKYIRQYAKLFAAENIHVISLQLNPIEDLSRILFAIEANNETMPHQNKGTRFNFIGRSLIKYNLLNLIKIFMPEKTYGRIRSLFITKSHFSPNFEQNIHEYFENELKEEMEFFEWINNGRDWRGFNLLQFNNGVLISS